MTANRTTSRSGSAGFTLVEMLMAMLILTVGLLGLLQSVNIAYKQSLRDRVRNEAVLLAEEQMHDLRRKVTEISADYQDSITVNRTIAGAPKAFTVKRDIKLMGASATRKLLVAVNWSINGENVSHTIYALKNR